MAAAGTGGGICGATGTGTGTGDGFAPLAAGVTEAEVAVECEVEVECLVPVVTCVCVLTVGGKTDGISGTIVATGGAEEAAGGALALALGRAEACASGPVSLFFRRLQAPTASASSIRADFETSGMDSPAMILGGMAHNRPRRRSDPVYLAGDWLAPARSDCQISPQRQRCPRTAKPSSCSHASEPR